MSALLNSGKVMLYSNNIRVIFVENSTGKKANSRQTYALLGGKLMVELSITI
jgi:hypothetical protein